MTWVDDLDGIIEDVAFSLNRSHGVGGLFVARAIAFWPHRGGLAMPVPTMGKMVAGSMAER